MSRTIGFILAGVIVVLCVVASIILVGLRPPNEPQIPPSLAPYVSTASIMIGDGAIPIYGGGTVIPRSELSVTAEVSGRVVWVNPLFQSGGRVTSGEILFRLDDADYQSQLQRARANVASQEVELMRVTAEAKIAETQFENWNRQDTTGSPSSLALWEPQIQAVQVALSRDQTELDEAELNLSRTIVRSPFAAAVVSESVTVGQFVRAGETVGNLYGIDLVEIVVSLPDESAALIPELWQLKPDSRSRSVVAKVIARYGDREYWWKGYVDRAEASIAQQTQTIEVVIQVPKPFTSGIASDSESTSIPPLLVGMYVDVVIDGLQPQEYFVARRTALKPDNEVWVVQENRTIRRIPVEVLQRSQDEVFLRGALESGQKVVLSGLDAVVDGMSVRIDS
ncbi:MAG: efflux RND transporter periplasmic adaptor subunit [Bacteroidetes bacterium]|nr:efflux RND transporter periplasmic adaptor subunit [Bacteroidota bacterium]MCY4233895.1 efflux RND transporter periplasmic adaptor subunit [Bacteroidota bacterium]